MRRSTNWLVHKAAAQSRHQLQSASFALQPTHRLLVEVAAITAQANGLALRLIAQGVEQRLDPAGKQAEAPRRLSAAADSGLEPGLGSSQLCRGALLLRWQTCIARLSFHNPARCFK